MLTQFNKIVLFIATTVLIILLILLYIFLSKSLFNNSHPPIISECPDYWDVSFNGEFLSCKNTSSINKGNGNPGCTVIPRDLNSQSISKKETLIELNNWAKSCGIIWDGVTNNTALS